MRDWHLKSVFTCNWLALPSSNLLELPLSNVFKLSVDIHDLLFLFFLSECAASLTSLDLRKSIYFPLHPIDLKSATHMLLQLWLIYFSKEVQICAVVFFMSIEPVERQSSIWIQGKRVLKLLQSEIMVHFQHILVSTRLCLLHFLPVISRR